MTCNRCGLNRSRYNVVRPPCVGIGNVKLCPACFQQGINKGNIVWVGSRAYGVCEDHLSVAS